MLKELSSNNSSYTVNANSYNYVLVVGGTKCNSGTGDGLKVTGNQVKMTFGWRDWILIEAPGDTHYNAYARIYKNNSAVTVSLTGGLSAGLIQIWGMN